MTAYETIDETCKSLTCIVGAIFKKGVRAVQITRDMNRTSMIIISIVIQSFFPFIHQQRRTFLLFHLHVPVILFLFRMRMMKKGFFPSFSLPLFHCLIIVPFLKAALPPMNSSQMQFTIFYLLSVARQFLRLYVSIYRYSVYSVHCVVQFGV